MSARERLNMAREQAGRELVALPLRRRIRIYLGGIGLMGDSIEEIETAWKAER